MKSGLQTVVKLTARTVPLRKIETVALRSVKDEFTVWNIGEWIMWTVVFGNKMQVGLRTVSTVGLRIIGAVPLRTVEETIALRAEGEQEENLV